MFLLTVSISIKISPLVSVLSWPWTSPLLSNRVRSAMWRLLTSKKLFSKSSEFPCRMITGHNIWDMPGLSGNLNFEYPSKFILFSSFRAHTQSKPTGQKSVGFVWKE